MSDIGQGDTLNTTEKINPDRVLDWYVDRLEAALRACWDEYHELMPDALHEQVKKALGIREFTAGSPDA